MHGTSFVVGEGVFRGLSLLICGSLSGCGLLADDVAPDASEAGATDTGEPETLTDGEAGDGGCIPIGQKVNLSFGNPCISMALWITLLPDGYTAWGGGADPTVLWSCSSASYNGCSVTYTGCSTPDGGSVEGSECTPHSMTLTWGSYCGGPVVPKEVACGSSQWTCSVPKLMCGDAPAVVMSN